MPFSLRRLSKTSFIALCFLALFVLGAFAIGKQQWFSPKPVPAAKVALVSAAVQAKKDPANKIEVELLTLTERGFEPKTLTRPKGKFLLAVETRTGLDQTLTLSLADDKKNRLKEYKAHGSRKGWTNIFDLNPGQYVVSVAEYPNWQCSITVTPQ